MPAKKRDQNQISPMEAIQFLEDFRKLSTRIDEPAQAISIRIPANILRALKTRAKIEGKKYQSLIVEILRKSLEK